MKTLCITTLLLLGFTAAAAQDISIDTISWTVEQAIDMDTTAVIDYSCVFLTRGSNSIDWIQKGGDRVYSFAVTSTEGVWTNTTEDGQFRYNISFQNFSGNITFERSNNEVTILLLLEADEQQSIYEKFVVTIQP